MEVTDANFAAVVLNSNVPVLVDFWAPWCGPAKMMGPTIDKLSRESGGKYAVVKLNVDDSPDTAQTYGGSNSIPTLMMFVGGKLVGTVYGFQTEPRLKEFIAQYT